MKLVYGICGFGNGHSARSAVVLEQLLARGHEVVLFTFMNSRAYFAAHFPAVPSYEIRVPVIPVSLPYGVDFRRTAEDPFNRYEDGQALNFGAMHGALETLGGKPDLILSDYEWIAGQMAYALEVPLVTIDQQSKFAGYHFPEITQGERVYSRLEEKSRLRLFFPIADTRLACSFFAVPYPPDEGFPAQLIPPLLRPELLALAPPDEPHQEVVVYFSPHGSLAQSPAEFYELFAQFPAYDFIVYSRQPESDRGNLRFHSFDTGAFFESLRTCAGVITTGGHNLLSEIVHLRKPVYTLPFTTFDQQACAAIIQDYGLGRGQETMNRADLADFLAALPDYRARLQDHPALLNANQGLGALLEILGQKFGL
jgi:uncharacterized protein (TIGR00661 family)